MIDPGSVGDWLQASLMAAGLAGLAATGRWALREEDADQPPQRSRPWVDRAAMGNRAAV